VVVHEGITLADASKVLDANKVGAAAVLDGGERLVGMISERDLLRSVGHGVDPASTSIDEVMTRDPLTLRTADTVTAALDIFVRQLTSSAIPILRGSHQPEVTHLCELSCEWLSTLPLFEPL
jgi:CBS domain-containing protein